MVHGKYPIQIPIEYHEKKHGAFWKMEHWQIPIGYFGKKMTQNILKSANILFFRNVAHDFMLCKCTFKYTINFFGMFSPFEKWIAILRCWFWELEIAISLI